MDNLLKFLFLCSDIGLDYWKSIGCSNRTIFLIGITTVLLSKTIFMGYDYRTIVDNV